MDRNSLDPNEATDEEMVSLVEYIITWRAEFKTNVGLVVDRWVSTSELSHYMEKSKKVILPIRRRFDELVKKGLLEKRAHRAGTFARYSLKERPGYYIRYNQFVKNVSTVS